MKFLRKKLDNIKPHFSRGGRFQKLAPAFNAFDTFLYTPDVTTHRGSHIRDGIDLKRVMVMVIISLLPALLFGTYNIGFQHFSQINASSDVGILRCFYFGLDKILPMILVSYGVGLAIEFVFAIYRGHEVNEGYLVSGMLIPLVMPVDLPLWMLAVSVVFAVVIGKEVFGGTGMNILNPALTARAFLFFAYPTYMSGDKVWVAGAANVDALSGETILGQLAQGNAHRSLVDGDPYSVADMFFGTIPGSIGETSTFWILLGGAFLLYTGVASWRIIISSVVGASLMGYIFNLVGANSLMSLPWWQHLIVGGFAFGMIFMATDPVSAAQTNKGKFVYGFLVGLLSIAIRVFNPAYPEGVMLAILFMNVFAPTVDHYVIRANINKRNRRTQNAVVRS